MHARIAETLEELYWENIKAHSVELVQHLAEAQTILGPDKLVKYSLLAGDQALAS